MKILFIRPESSIETIGLQHVMIVEPLELEVLSSLTSSEDTPIILDMLLEKKDFKHFLIKYTPDIICLTGYITSVPKIKEYCSIAKSYNSNIKTIVGGVHCEVCPEDLNHKSIDYRVVRNATTIFPQLLQHIKNNSGKPKGILTFNEECNFSELPTFNFYYPLPNRNLINKYQQKYFYIFQNKVALIKTSFGCPFKCSFCFCRQITKDNYFERDINDVINELRQIKQKEIYIVDDDFLSSPKRVNSFLDKLEEYNIKKRFLIYGRADFIVKNTKIIKRFRKLGLDTIIVGFESFNNLELDIYNKKTDSMINEKAMKILNKYNIDCFATIIISPNWSKNDFERCGEKLISLGIHFVNLQPLTPLPGTDFEQKYSDIIIKRDDFEKWDLAHVSIKPTEMSLSEFYMSIIKLYEKVLFRPSVIWMYLKRYPIYMLFKMLKGSLKVRSQYLKKYIEALRNE